MTNTTNTLTSLLSAATDYKVSTLNSCLPGVVHKYDGNNRCSVKPLINKLTPSGEIIEHSIINRVPVYRNFSGGAALDMPIKKGDQGIILYCSAAIDEWLESGAIDPLDSRTFDYNDAIFIPGIENFVGSKYQKDNDNVRLRYNGGEFVVNSDGKIAIGNASIELLDLFEQLITALEQTTTQTLLGNQPLSKFLDGTFTVIKSKLLEIKGNI